MYGPGDDQNFDCVVLDFIYVPLIGASPLRGWSVFTLTASRFILKGVNMSR